MSASGRTPRAPRFVLQQVRRKDWLGTEWDAMDTRTESPVVARVIPARFLTHREDPTGLQRVYAAAKKAQEAQVDSQTKVLAVRRIEVLGQPTVMVVRTLGGRHHLRSFVERAGVLDERTAFLLTMQILGALEDARLAGLVHGAVRPERVEVHRKPGCTRLHLTEHGLLASLGQDLELMALERPGEGAWTAPEVLHGHTADERADVYGAGQLLRYLLTGARPDQAIPPGLAWSDRARHIVDMATRPSWGNRTPSLMAFMGGLEQAARLARLSPIAASARVHVAA